MRNLPLFDRICDPITLFHQRVTIISKLAISNLSYERNDQQLLGHINFTLAAQQGLLVTGPNGAGKTTLLRIIAGLLMPTTGQITWQDNCYLAETTRYHQALHYLGHANALQLNLSVAENVRYFLQLQQMPVAIAVETVLQQLGLYKIQNQLAKQLSAGQKRRLALAKLLLIQKPLWILDEPFANLDKKFTEFFAECITQHLQNGGMVLLAAHQFEPKSSPPASWLENLELRAC